MEKSLKIAVWFVIAALSLSGCSTHPLQRSSTSTHPELERLVGDRCAKEFVFLGEGAQHDGGGTLRVKIDLVRRLIDHCGFNTVMFESQVYDFYDLDRRYRSQRATSEHLYDAIGALWSTSEELDQLVPYLHSKAMSGQVTLRGLDPQMGGATQFFTQRRLPEELARVLPEERHLECQEEIYRHTNWLYDSESSYDQAAKGRLLACAREIQSVTARSDEKHDGTALMAENLVRYLTLEEADYSNSWNARDKAMFRNFEAQLAWGSGQPKVIVWGATIHGLKETFGDGKDRVPLGTHLRSKFGERYAVIGFTAQSGNVGRQGQSVELVPPAPQALESSLPPTPRSELHYLTHSDLAILGRVPAYLIGYAQPQLLDWSEFLDGAVVLKTEHPQTMVRPARPLQANQVETP